MNGKTRPGAIPRFTTLDFPAYAHLPGRTPHPQRDSAGHGLGAAPEAGAPDPDRWAESTAYLFGVDLFNHGYFWEAHEAWEGLWHAAGRHGPAADILKALIALAAAALKARTGQVSGIRRHAGRAATLLRDVGGYADADGRFMGLHLQELARQADAIAAGRTQDMDITLRPESCR